MLMAFIAALYPPREGGRMMKALRPDNLSWAKFILLSKTNFSDSSSANGRGKTASVLEHKNL